MSIIRQNSQINPYPSEILISIYLVITGFIIFIFHSQLTNINSHIEIRFVVLLLILYLSYNNLEKWQFMRYFRVFLPFFLLAYLYSETDYLNNLFINKDLDPYISNIETFLFAGQPAIKFASTFPSDFFAELMYLGYFSYYLLIIGIPVYFYFFINETLGLRTIFIIICSFLIYYIIYIFFPVSGPQYYFSMNLKPLPQGFLFGKIIRLIQTLGEAPTAAFPSSHVSICMMLLWICFKNAKNLLFVIVPVAFLLILSTVYIRAHYVIDVLAGFVFTPLIYPFSVYIYKLMYNNNLATFIIKKEYEYRN